MNILLEQFNIGAGKGLPAYRRYHYNDSLSHYLQWITFTCRRTCSLLWAPPVPKMVRWWWHCLIASRKRGGQDLKVSYSCFKPQSKISSYSFPIFPIFGTVVSHLQDTHSFWSSLYSGHGDDGNYGGAAQWNGPPGSTLKNGGRWNCTHARLDWWFPMPIATVHLAGVTDLKITSNDDCSRMSSQSKMKISVIFCGGVK